MPLSFICPGLDDLLKFFEALAHMGVRSVRVSHGEARVPKPNPTADRWNRHDRRYGHTARSETAPLAS